MALVNDVLDLSRIESDRMSLEKVPFDPAEVAADALKSVTAQAQQKRIEVRRILPQVSYPVVGDPLRFRQILLNLLGNAVKFTEHGWVQLAMRQSRTETGLAQWEISVEDTGTGIPADKQPVIFEKFTQADGSISRRFGGSGLGLAITRKLVELHGGEIRVESQEGRGSTFTVTLRYEPADEPVSVSALDCLSAAAALPGDGRPGAAILLVEDNQVNQRVVTAILRKRGYRVDVAGDGQEALGMLSKAMYSLVLMDIQMPVMDGLEATRRLRKDPRWRDLPVVAMTAHAMTGDRECCLEAGMNGYISKPVHSAHLLTVVERYTKTSSTPAAVCTTLAQASPKASPIDARMAAKLMDNDASLMEGLVSLFLQLAPERLQKMHTAAAKGKTDCVLQEAQQMRTAAEHIAATAVTGCLRRIEESAGSGHLPALKHSLLLLEAEIQRLSRHAGGWYDKVQRAVASG
jgi:CheY-like chemotaxis protein